MSETRPAPGAQTLARGLRALQLVANAPEGATIQELAEQLEVHRSIVSRLLLTLVDFKLVAKGADGRFRAGSGLAILGSRVHTTLRLTAEPVLRELAGQLGASISLLVAEAGEAVALTVVEPPSASYVLSFKTGGRHPLGVAAGGVALLAALPPAPGEAARVTEARERGYAITKGEVEPGAYGVAVPLPAVDGLPAACLNLISHREEIAEQAPPALIAAAARITAALA